MTTRLADVEPTPDVFAAVMATGILSVAAHDHGYRRISESLGVIATCALVFLVAMVTTRVAVSRSARGKLHWDLTDPDVTLRLFTFVAACAVIDTRLSSNVWVVRVLGAVALSCWLLLIGVSARNM